MTNEAMTAVERLTAWASQHSNVTPLDGTDRNSPTFGDLRTLLTLARQSVVQQSDASPP